MGWTSQLSNHISKKALIIAFIHWYATFFVEKSFFVTSTLEKPFVAVAKLLVIICFWQIAFYMVKRYKTEPEYRRYIHFAGAYFIFSMIVLLLIWPGNWNWDEFTIMRPVSQFRLASIQHFLMSIFYLIGIFLFPEPFIVVVLQIFIISLIVGYFINCIFHATHQSKLTLVAYIPFLLPAVLLMNNYALRSTLFGYMLLLFLTILFFKKTKYFTLAICTVFLSTLRGEGIYFLILAPLLFILTYWYKTSKLQKTLFIFIVTLCSLSITNYQSQINAHISQGFSYKLTTYITPLGFLINHADNENRNDLITPITPYLNIDLLKISRGDEAIWANDFFKPEFTQNPKLAEDVIFKSFMVLVKTYPKEFFSERWQLFKKTSKSAPPISGEYEQTQIAQQYGHQFFENNLSSYLNKDGRHQVLSILYENRIFNNITIPTFFLLFLSLLCLIYRQYTYALIVAAPLPAFTLVILTAPSPYFMYYFSIYLTGYAFGFGALIIVLSRLISQTSKLMNHKI